MAVTARCEAITTVRAADPPADHVINTFHFVTEAPAVADADLQELSDALRDVYYAAGFAPDWGFQANRNGLINVYRLDDPKPRPIRAHSQHTVQFPEATPMAPRQMALCLSYYADRNLPRQRGRIYIGPFAGSVSERPPDNVLAQWLDLGKKLMQCGVNLTPSWAWCVFSPTYGTSLPISHVWVNDEMDVVRRRGAKETKRLRFP
jgi:hypothetical protein